MQRIVTNPRPNWQSTVSDLGLIWHSADQKTYWDEGVYYQFTSSQIEQIEEATAECYNLMVAAGQRVVDERLFYRFGIPDWAVPSIEASWSVSHFPPSLNYGRFDFGYDGVNPPKMFEFNCDTPTSLLEASVIQWDWMEEKFPGSGPDQAIDQFNSIHEALVARFRFLRGAKGVRTVHFAHTADDVGEDTMTVTYMRDCAEQAGIDTVPLLMEEIGLTKRPFGLGGEFIDTDGDRIHNLFKLYPWEWILNEDFGRALVAEAHANRINVMEPIWKMIWSNKAILPILHEVAPDHPNLLPAFFDAPVFDMNRRGQRFFKKPILAREGANISCIDTDGSTVAMTNGSYGSEGYIYQEAFDLPGEGNQRPVIGSWVVAGEPCGMGIREDGLITGNGARFVPHIIKDN